MNVESPDLLLELLNKAFSDIDDLLNDETPSSPAVWDRASQSLFRVHLSEEDERLPACKAKIRAIKAAIKAQLEAECGDTWMHRMPFDQPLARNPEIADIR
jgi:hypothetical protein